MNLYFQNIKIFRAKAIRHKINEIKWKDAEKTHTIGSHAHKHTDKHTHAKFMLNLDLSKGQFLFFITDANVLAEMQMRKKNEKWTFSSYLRWNCPQLENPKIKTEKQLLLKKQQHEMWFYLKKEIICIFEWIELCQVDWPTFQATKWHVCTFFEFENRWKLLFNYAFKWTAHYTIFENR